MKTSELTDDALDWAVAKCENFTTKYETDRSDFWINRTNHASLFLPPFGYLKEVFFPSSDWSQGGEIIERERIGTWPSDSIEGMWAARPDYKLYPARLPPSYGPTPLIAAMRCYVASKLGDNVDIPTELMQ